MKAFFLSLLCAAPWVSARADSALDRHTADAVRTLLVAYQRLSESRSTAFYDLYADQARIEMQAAGSTARTVFEGDRYKRWGKELLAREQAFPDASRFSDPTVGRDGERLIVRAHRYSIDHCVWDEGYALVIAPVGEAYHIVEEHLTVHPGATCPAGAFLPATGAVAAHPAWRPLSPEEISAAAQKLAARMPAHPPAGTGVVPTITPPRPLVAAPASTPSELWVDP